MEAKRCANGHYYDSEKYSSCPFCEGNETMPIGGTLAMEADGFNSVPPTAPFSEAGGDAFGSELGKTLPMDPETGVNLVDDEQGVTRPYDEANLGFVPTVGWVICIRGPHKGKDFRLVTGYNKIGRSSDMAISLPDDDQVTREAHAIIAYDPQAHKFFASGDKNMIYLNGEFMIGMKELKINDIIKVGASELMFVPLCGEAFSWE